MKKVAEHGYMDFFTTQNHAVVCSAVSNASSLPPPFLCSKEKGQWIDLLVVLPLNIFLSVFFNVFFGCGFHCMPPTSYGQATKRCQMEQFFFGQLIYDPCI